MAGKRGASSDLNNDNWDKEEEPEDCGTFQRASDDALRKRIVKTARRRNPISSVRESGDEGEKKSAFSNFGGFGKSAPPSTTSAFSFLSNLTTPAPTQKVNGIENKTKVDSPIVKFSITSNSDKEQSENPMTSKSTPTSSNSTPPSGSDSDKSNIYFSKLKGLNQSVSSWIKKHVDSNPFISLVPIFKDYEKYFNELEKEKEVKSIPDASKVTPVVSSITTFTFKPSTDVPDSTTEKNLSEVKKPDIQVDKTTESNVPKFSFGNITSNAPSASTPIFNFGNKTTSSFSFGTTTTQLAATTSTTIPSFSFGTKPASTTFPSFGTSTPFKFDNGSQPTSTGEAAKEEEVEEPPKNEFTPVVEKDNIFTTRCKVFVKKDDVFGDRGVGNLFLKKVEGSEKIQAIVRADTNLGNLLLNFILSQSIPTKRLGKKDVMLVCVPTPENEPPPVPVLLRFKSPEEADKVLETLEAHKK